jgi:hypothetical protein
MFRKLVSLWTSLSTVMQPHRKTLHFEAYNSLAIMAIVATMPPIIAITIDSANISIYILVEILIIWMIQCMSISVSKPS